MKFTKVCVELIVKALVVLFVGYLGVLAIGFAYNKSIAFLKDKSSVTSFLFFFVLAVILFVVVKGSFLLAAAIKDSIDNKQYCLERKKMIERAEYEKKMKMFDDEIDDALSSLFLTEAKRKANEDLQASLKAQREAKLAEMFANVK